MSRPPFDWEIDGGIEAGRFTGYEEGDRVLLDGELWECHPLPGKPRSHFWRAVTWTLAWLSAKALRRELGRR